VGNDLFRVGGFAVLNSVTAVEDDGWALARRLAMAWYRVKLDEVEQRVVVEERDSHHAPHVRRKMLVLWSLHCGLLREQAAKVAGMGVATVGRYVAAYRDGGLDCLRQWNVTGPVSDLAAHRESIRESLERQPARTTAEGCARIEQLTGLKRRPTQVRVFLKRSGLKWQRIRAIPVPPKKNWTSMSPIRPCSTISN
jgi:transposase